MRRSQQADLPTRSSYYNLPTADGLRRRPRRTAILMQAAEPTATSISGRHASRSSTTTMAKQAIEPGRARRRVDAEDRSVRAGRDRRLCARSALGFPHTGQRDSRLRRPDRRPPQRSPTRRSTTTSSGRWPSWRPRSCSTLVLGFLFGRWFIRPLLRDQGRHRRPARGPPLQSHPHQPGRRAGRPGEPDQLGGRPALGGDQPDPRP